MKFALFGGSFNPPHFGHLMACHYVLGLGYDRVVMLPVYNHPLNKKLLPFDQRFEMCCLLANDYDKIVVSVRERDNPTGKTIDLLKQYEESKIPNHGWVIGSDCMAVKNEWEGFDEVEKIIELIPVNRFGAVIKGRLVEFSSTYVRKTLASGEEPEILPVSILDYIYKNKIDKQFTKEGGIL